MVVRRCVAWLGVLLFSTLAFGQDSFVSNWLEMVTQTENDQPHWAVPLATLTPTLHQLFRDDTQWQTYNSGVTATNYGASKGLEFIPEKHVEVILAIPPYLVDNPNSQDGLATGSSLPSIELRQQARSTGTIS